MYRFREGGACALALLAVAAAGCTAVDNVAVGRPADGLDEAVFQCNVEPILARQCSYNACHGNAGSPLRVYTPGKLRATPPKDIDAAIAELTVAEHHANYLSATGFAYDITAVDDNWLLRKPLATAEGGYEHVGGVIFTGGGDPQYGTIRAWLTNTGVCK